MSQAYENADKHTAGILETISLFKDSPAALKRLIKLHVEVIYAEGKVAGVEQVKP
jgi:hypothetical protein